MATETRSELPDDDAFISRQLGKAGPLPNPEQSLSLWREVQRA